MSLTVAQRIRSILDARALAVAEFARGGGGGGARKSRAKSKLGGGKGKAVNQATCGRVGGRFAPGHSCNGAPKAQRDAGREAGKRTLGSLIAKTRAAAQAKSRANTAAEIRAAKGPEGERAATAGRKAAVGRMVGKSKGAAESKAVAVASKPVSTKADRASTMRRLQDRSRASSDAAKRAANSRPKAIPRDAPIEVGKVTTYSGRKSVEIRRGAASLTVEQVQKGGKEYRVKTSYYDTGGSSAMGGVRRVEREIGTFDSLAAAKAHAKTQIATIGAVEPGGKPLPYKDAKSTAPAKPAPAKAASTKADRAGSIKRMVNRSRKMSDRQATRYVPRPAKLKGSEKQVAWAEKIQANKIARVEDHVRSSGNKPQARAALSALRKQDEARFWIDRKDIGARALLHEARKLVPVPANTLKAAPGPAPPRPTSTKADRAAALKKLTDKSRVASGKAGAANAARYRTAGVGGRTPDLEGAVPPPRSLASSRARAGREEARSRMVRASREAVQGARMVATKRAKQAASSAPARPVTPPPPAVAARPITDPVRVKAEVQKFDEAFGRLPGARENFVALADVRKTMPHLSKGEFDTLVKREIAGGRYTLDPAEGVTSASPAARAGGVVVPGAGREGEHLMVYVKRRT